MMDASWRVARHLWRYPAASPNDGDSGNLWVQPDNGSGNSAGISAGIRVVNVPSRALPLREHWSVRAWDLRPRLIDRTALHTGPRSGPSCRRCGFSPAPAGEGLRPLRAGLQSIGSWRQARLHPETTAHAPRGP